MAAYIHSQINCTLFVRHKHYVSYSCERRYVNSRNYVPTLRNLRLQPVVCVFFISIYLFFLHSNVFPLLTSAIEVICRLGRGMKYKIVASNFLRIRVCHNNTRRRKKGWQHVKNVPIKRHYCALPHQYWNILGAAAYVFPMPRSGNGFRPTEGEPHRIPIGFLFRHLNRITNDTRSGNSNNWCLSVVRLTSPDAN